MQKHVHLTCKVHLKLIEKKNNHDIYYLNLRLQGEISNILNSFCVILETDLGTISNLKWFIQAAVRYWNIKLVFKFEKCKLNFYGVSLSNSSNTDKKSRAWL